MPPRTTLISFLRNLSHRASPVKPNNKPSPPRVSIRHQSTTPPHPSPSRARIDRVLNRLPKFLHPYTNGLRSAPVSHITSFLILHELTAIIPLVGLATLFHYTNWLPEAFAEVKWVSEGVERFGRYFGRKGWFGFSKADIAVEDAPGGIDGQSKDSVREDLEASGEKEREADIEKRWHVGENGSRILVEVATAYAITKVLLPLRIIVSVWGTPWFARIVLGRFAALFGRGKSASTVGKVADVTKKAQ